MYARPIAQLRARRFDSLELGEIVRSVSGPVHLGIVVGSRQNTTRLLTLVGPHPFTMSKVDDGDCFIDVAAPNDLHVRIDLEASDQTNWKTPGTLTMSEGEPVVTIGCGERMVLFLNLSNWTATDECNVPMPSGGFLSFASWELGAIGPVGFVAIFRHRDPAEAEVC